MNYFPEEKRQKRSEKIMHKIKTLERNEQLSCQNKRIPLAQCIQRLLKFYVKFSKNDTTDEFHIYGNRGGLFSL